MREYLFRAWDKKKNQFVGFGNETLSKKYGRHIPISVNYNDGYFSLRNEFFYITDIDLIYMQYIGLKDKNNKKIFEGDILNLYSWEEEGDTVKRIIEFKDGEYIIKEITDKDPVYCNVSMIGLEDCEIIGNIYENPKLMEEK